MALTGGLARNSIRRDGGLALRLFVDRGCGNAVTRKIAVEIHGIRTGLRYLNYSIAYGARRCGY